MPQVRGLVDIHSHLLPGIDDGPEDLEGSLDMARAAVAAGISTMAATPHLRSDFPGVHVEEIGPRCQDLQRILDGEGIPLRVVSGAEASLVWALEASDEELKLASYGQRGSDLLIETPGDLTMFENLLQAIGSKGFRITLAHPERSPEFWRRPERLERLAEQGVLLQINAAAVLRRRGRSGGLAQRLLQAGVVDAIGSDAHRATEWRAITELPAAAQQLSALVGPERAEWMCSGAPSAVLHGGRLPEAPAAVRPRRRWRWFRFS